MNEADCVQTEIGSLFYFETETKLTTFDNVIYF